MGRTSQGQGGCDFGAGDLHRLGSQNAQHDDGRSGRNFFSAGQGQELHAASLHLDGDLARPPLVRRDGEIGLPRQADRALDVDGAVGPQAVGHPQQPADGVHHRHAGYKREHKGLARSRRIEQAVEAETDQPEHCHGRHDRAEAEHPHEPLPAPVGMGGVEVAVGIAGLARQIDVVAGAKIVVPHAKQAEQELSRQERHTDRGTIEIEGFHGLPSYAGGAEPGVPLTSVHCREHCEKRWAEPNGSARFAKMLTFMIRFPSRMSNTGPAASSIWSRLRPPRGDRTGSCLCQKIDDFGWKSSAVESWPAVARPTCLAQTSPDRWIERISTPNGREAWLERLGTDILFCSGMCWLWRSRRWPSPWAVA